MILEPPESNMVFSMAAVANASAEIAEADQHPNIRLFTVGQGSHTEYAAPDLQTIEQRWAVASHETVSNKQRFGYFSAVCYIFGRQLSAAVSTAASPLPIGLISSNWGGTPVEAWSPRAAFGACNRTEDPGQLYNAMIAPFTVGPLALRGFTWYQGEQNTAGAQAALDYACLFPAMITAWRTAFHLPTAFFGFVQLSTWCPRDPMGLAMMRQKQLAALALPAVAFSTNADHGAGCNIHPPPKQFCAERLATAALNLLYGQRHLVWRSPAIDAASAAGALGAVECKPGQTGVSLTLPVANVTAVGLELRAPANAISELNCSGLNEKTPDTCAWVNVTGVVTTTAEDDGLVKSSASAARPFARNATISVHGSKVQLSWPCESEGAAYDVQRVRYGWGSIPMMSVYDKGSGLPLLPFELT